MYETAKETLMYRTVLWTLWERETVGRFGRMAMKHVLLKDVPQLVVKHSKGCLAKTLPT